MLSLSKQLEGFRLRGELPESLTKRFIKALTQGERSRLAAMLRSKLNDALDGDAGETELFSMCARVVRVRNFRRSKGEIR